MAAVLLLLLAVAPTADASVYWGNPIGTGNSIGTTIGRANDDGTGVNQSFIGGASEPTGVAVDAAHVYWINELDHSIGRANLDGTGVNQRFVTGVNGDALAVDGMHIYWTNIIAIAPQDAPDDAIGRANLDGTGVDQNFITGASTPQGVAVDRAHVYWTNSDRHAIGRANLDGTGVNQNFTDVGFGRLPVGVAVDAAHIYWANINANTIGRANLDGTGVSQNFIEGADVPFGVAVDAAHLYWTNQFPSPDGTDGGTIARANLDGTGVNQSFIAGFTGDPIGVAVTPSAQTEQAARISINDVTMAEGNAGQTAFRFTASLDAPQPAPVTVDFATADRTATAPSDYAPNSATVTFPPGDTAEPVTVQVNGDTTVEPDEAFNVSLSNPGGSATIADAKGVATIVNDDQAATGQPPSISLDNFGGRTLVTLKLAARRIGARGALKVLVKNANGFEVLGKLSGRTVDRGAVSSLRPVKLSTKSFRVAAHATKTVKLRLPKVLGQVPRRQHKLFLRLTAKVTDPAGNARAVRKSVAPRRR